MTLQSIRKASDINHLETARDIERRGERKKKMEGWERGEEDQEEIETTGERRSEGEEKEKERELARR